MAVRIFVALITLAGAAGWVFAFLAMQERDTLERRAIAAETELAEVSKTATSYADMINSYKRGEKAVELEEIRKQLKMGREELASLTTKLQPAQEALATLIGRTDAEQAKLERIQTIAERYEDLFTEPPRKFRTIARARVRAGPGTGFKEVATIPNGMTLPVFESVQDGSWRKVGYVGYMHRDLLEPLVPD